MSSEDIFEPHSEKQFRLINSDFELTIGATGTQWGKSRSAALWLKRQIWTYTNPDDKFMIVAPTYKIMNQSATPYFLHYLRGHGRYLKSEARFELHDGRNVFLRTETDPDSVVGIPDTRAFWLDEAGKVSLYFWENIQARAASKGAKGMLTTSPYSRNWLYKQIIKPKLQDRNALPDIALIQAASWENPFHTLSIPENRQKMRSRMDARRFDMMFGGEWGQMAGLVYDCWDEDQNTIEPFQLHPDTRYYGGIDWGFTDPFVLKVRAITPDGRHYGVSEFYKTGQTITDIIEVCKQKKITFGIKTFYADPSQPGMIEELCRNGIPTIAADNDIRRGIDLHYELIKQRKYKEFRGSCPYSSDERETYHYPEPEDLGPDDDSKELLPVDQANHAMDVDRYLTISLYRTDMRRSPKTPSETPPRHKDHHERLRFLKRRRNPGQTENWS